MNINTDKIFCALISVNGMRTVTGNFLGTFNTLLNVKCTNEDFFLLALINDQYEKYVLKICNLNWNLSQLS